MSEGRGAGSDGRASLVLGAFAMVVTPMSFILATGSLPIAPIVAAVLPVLRYGGLGAAIAAIVLGRRARLAGDRSTGAVWGPRLGGAAILGFVVTVFGLASNLS